MRLVVPASASQSTSRRVESCRRSDGSSCSLCDKLILHFQLDFVDQHDDTDHSVDSSQYVSSFSIEEVLVEVLYKVDTLDLSSGSLMGLDN